MTNLSAETNYLVLPAYELQWSEEQKEKIQVGDRLVFVLKGVSQEKKLPKEVLVKTISEEKSLFEQGWMVSSEKKNDQLLLIVYALKPGSNKIPAMILAGEKSKDFARTYPFSLTVDAPFVVDDNKAQEALPFYPPVKVLFPVWVIVLSILIFIALLSAIIFLAIRWSKNKKTIEVVIPVKPLKPEDEEAIAALNRLIEQKLWEQKKYKQHYFKASEIIKSYFSRRYLFEACESTSEEILYELENKIHSDGSLDLIEELLRLMDEVKFADKTPEDKSAQKIIMQAKEIVKRTKKITQVSINESQEKTDAV